MEYLSLDVLPDLTVVVLAISKARDVEAETIRKSTVKVPSVNVVRMEANVFVKPVMVTKAIEKSNKRSAAPVSTSTDWTCYNCNVLNPRHDKGNCDRPANTCDTCGKQWHLTEYHDRVV